MDKVPTIGGARGIFEIFVPGAFLLLNLATAMYLWPVASDQVRLQLASIFTNTSVFLIASITLGYLFGVVLRLLRSEMPDRLSAWFLRCIHPRKCKERTDENQWAYERFPFPNCMRVICRDRMPPDVLKFDEAVWGPCSSKHFFNLCKLMVASEDPKAAEEVSLAEALCRHISGMFYALTASLAALLSVDIAIWVFRGLPSFVLTSVVLVYLIATLVILANFRFMRLKEVEMVFAASYRNRDKLPGAGLASSEILSTRVLHAPREVVFEAFTDPDRLAKWWGPKGFTNTFHEFLPQTGGVWRFVMHGPDGTDYPMVKDFVEVVPCERIVLQHVEPIHSFRMVMTFAKEAGGTRLTWRMHFESVEEAEKVRGVIAEANEQNFDRLEALLRTAAT